MIEIPLLHVLILSALLFVMGLAVVLIRKNAILIFMGLELMLNAVNISFVAFAWQHGSMEGVVFVFFVLVVAAAEAVIGLSIMLALYRHHQTLDIQHFNLLKW